MTNPSDAANDSGVARRTSQFNAGHALAIVAGLTLVGCAAHFESRSKTLDALPQLQAPLLALLPIDEKPSAIGLVRVPEIPNPVARLRYAGVPLPTYFSKHEECLPRFVQHLLISAGFKVALTDAYDLQTRRPLEQALAGTTTYLSATKLTPSVAISLCRWHFAACRRQVKAGPAAIGIHNGKCPTPQSHRGSAAGDAP